MLLQGITRDYAFARQVLPPVTELLPRARARLLRGEGAPALRLRDPALRGLVTPIVNLRDRHGQPERRRWSHAGSMTTELPNWGHWGEDDERGALNLITDEVRGRAAREVRTGRWVPSALPIEAAPAGPGARPATVLRTGDRPHPSASAWRRSLGILTAELAEPDYLMALPATAERQIRLAGALWRPTPRP